MDAAKLENVLIDLVSDKAEENEGNLNLLVSSISSNDSTKIKDALGKLEVNFSSSVINDYSPSNFEILKKIGATDYFGSSAMDKINSILNSNSYNVTQIVNDLQNYVKKRKTFVETITSVESGLSKLDITAHFSREMYEVGILLPGKDNGNKINKVTKELNRWDKVFKTIKELTGEEVTDTEINFVSNGSLQFFIHNAPTVAKCAALGIAGVINLYKNIVEIRAARETLKKLGVTPAETKSIEKQEKEHFNSQLDRIAADLIKQFASKKIEDGRVNELRVAMNGHVSYIAKCIDDGITIEVTPPELLAPEKDKEADTPETKEAKKLAKEKYDKTLKEIAVVQKAMETVKSLGLTGIDIIKYLNDDTSKNDIEDDLNSKKS